MTNEPDQPQPTGPEDIEFTESADQPQPPETDAGAAGEDGRVLTLQAEIDKAKDQLLRALAETENIRRRAAKEREDATKYAVTSFARDLLDFSDNFHRALQSMHETMSNSGDERITNLMNGLDAMEQQLARTLEKHGIKKIQPLHEKFDPNFHEVIFEAPGTGKPAGIIIQVAEPGYTIQGRLLRPARVGVAKDDGTNPHKIDTQA